MKIFLLVLLVALTLIGGLNMLSTRRIAPVTPATATLAAPSQPAPVVIELFTSEGCSSCPPADALLLKLVEASPVPEAEIIALSEHVDYWNYIGWADPFSAALYSTRQQAYAQALGQRGLRGDVYTPQMIVDGQFAFVGSNTQQAQAAIKQALTLPKAKVEISEQPATTLKEPLKLHIRISDIPAQATPESAEVVLVITENNLASSVTRGENSGRRLPHTAVTRELRVLGTITPQQKSFEIDALVKLAANWQRAELRAIVLVQERVQRRILGAGAIKLN